MIAACTDEHNPFYRVVFGFSRIVELSLATSQLHLIDSVARNKKSSLVYPHSRGAIPTDPKTLYFGSGSPSFSDQL